MASYPATGPTTYKRNDDSSGAGVKVLALFLGIAVGVLVIVSAVLIKMTDDARDQVRQEHCTSRRGWGSTMRAEKASG